MCAFISLLYLWLFFTYIPVHLFHFYICDFFSHLYLWFYFTYIWVILNHTSRFLSFLFQIPFPKIIPSLLKNASHLFKKFGIFSFSLLKSSLRITYYAFWVLRIHTIKCYYPMYTYKDVCSFFIYATLYKFSIILSLLYNDFYIAVIECQLIENPPLSFMGPINFLKCW